MLGISIYPDKQDQNEIIKYIDLAHSLGYKNIFTCLLSIEGGKEEIINKYTNIIKYANQLKMRVTLDIAPKTFGDFGISYDDLSFFAKMGANTIRLDVGFDGLKESLMTFNKYNLNIEINMSNGTKYLDNIISHHPNKNRLQGCHNFYPQEYTGLKLNHFINCSLNFKNNNIKTAAFITSQDATVGPWPIMDGLCTLEMHRNLPVAIQLKHMMGLNLIDTIFIGNAFASEQELRDLASIYFSKSLSLNVNFLDTTTYLDKQIVLDEMHFNRGDVSNYMIRSTQSRVKYKSSNFPQIKNPEFFQKGDIVICNDSFGQYKGELQLILANQKNTDNRRNLVARVVNDELFLIDYIKPWSIFAFNNK